MNTYIALLRGVNVSGQKSIKMDQLKELCANLDFRHTETYIQSGNIVFQSNVDDSDYLADLLTTAIKKHFEFDVPALVLTADDLRMVIDNNPYKSKEDASFLHLTLLASTVDVIDLDDIRQKRLEGEDVTITERVIYLCCPHGYGKTKLTNTFFEKKLKVSATTRNWKTVNALLSIATQKERV